MAHSDFFDFIACLQFLFFCYSHSNCPSLSKLLIPVCQIKMSTDTMKAVVFHGPGKVTVEDRPIPKIKDDGDIVVKVDKVRL